MFFYIKTEIIILLFLYKLFAFIYMISFFISKDNSINTFKSLLLFNIVTLPAGIAQ